MKEIDLKSIFFLLLTKIQWIIAGVAVLALLFGGYAHFFVPEQYTSTAKVYVRNTKVDYEVNGTTSGNLTAAQQLVNNYSIHMKTKSVLDAAVAQLDGKITADQLGAGASASGMGETSWLSISVTLGDPELAQAACRALANASAQTFAELDVASATVRDVSPGVKTAPNVTKNALIGALVGLVLTVGVILLRYLTENTVHDKQDLVARIDVPVLGEIPSFELTQTKPKRRGGYGHA